MRSTDIFPGYLPQTKFTFKGEVNWNGKMGPFQKNFFGIVNFLKTLFRHVFEIFISDEFWKQDQN